MPKKICELCNKEFFYRGGTPTICKRKKCVEYKKQKGKEYQKKYRAKVNDEFDKMREEMEKNREEVDREYRERTGKAPKGGYYASQLIKDSKKDWENKKFYDIQGNEYTGKSQHAQGVKYVYTSKRIKT